MLREGPFLGMGGGNPEVVALKAVVDWPFLSRDRLQHWVDTIPKMFSPVVSMRLRELLANSVGDGAIELHACTINVVQPAKSRWTWSGATGSVNWQAVNQVKQFLDQRPELPRTEVQGLLAAAEKAKYDARVLDLLRGEVATHYDLSGGANPVLAKMTIDVGMPSDVPGKTNWVPYAVAGGAVIAVAAAGLGLYYYGVPEVLQNAAASLANWWYGSGTGPLGLPPRSAAQGATDAASAAAMPKVADAISPRASGFAPPALQFGREGNQTTSGFTTGFSNVVPRGYGPPAMSQEDIAAFQRVRPPGQPVPSWIDIAELTGTEKTKYLSWLTTHGRTGLTAQDYYDYLGEMRDFNLAHPHE
jgi:hypothetical protein